MERYLKFREEYSRFFYRGYDVEETLNELKITYTFEIEGLSAFTPTWTFPKNGNPEAKWMEDHLLSTGGDRGRKFIRRADPLVERSVF